MSDRTSVRGNTVHAVASPAAASRGSRVVLLWRPVLTNLGYDFFCQAVGGNQFGPLAVHGRQAGLARVVDEGHPRKVSAEDWFALMGQGTLPALLDLLHPSARQPPFEPEGQRLLVVMDGDT